MNKKINLNSGNAGLNYELIPNHLKKWDIFGKINKSNENKIWVVVNTDQARAVEVDFNEIPLGHTIYSWYSNKSNGTPLGHTDFSIGKK